MRILKSGNGQMVPERPCTCTYCRCEFAFREDEARLIDDSRDGDYFRIACPQCRVLNSVSVKVPTLNSGA
jgi:phage FluMu protein Com